MNIQTVVRMEGYAVPGGSSYLYGTTPQRAAAPAPPVERIEIPGPREMDVVYQYRVLEGWRGAPGPGTPTLWRCPWSTTETPTGGTTSPCPTCPRRVS